MSSEPLSPAQLDRLEMAFRLGGEHASDAMAKWLTVPSLIAIESVDQLPIAEAADLHEDTDEALCFCLMAINGSLTGHLILCFDDISGLLLADLLLGQAEGTASAWGEVEQSAALESHNVIGCAYLNSLAKHLPGAEQQSLELIPSPPQFRRDFAESLLQAVFIDQAQASDFIFTAKARFELRGQPLHWTMMFVPDAPSMDTLRKILTSDGTATGEVLA